MSRTLFHPLERTTNTHRLDARMLLNTIRQYDYYLLTEDFDSCASRMQICDTKSLLIRVRVVCRHQGPRARRPGVMAGLHGVDREHLHGHRTRRCGRRV